MTLTGHHVITFDGSVRGRHMLLRLTQDGSGRRMVTWPKNVKWVGGQPPVLSTAPGTMDIISFYDDGRDYFAAYGLNFS